MGELIKKIKKIKGIGFICFGIIAGIILIIVGSINFQTAESDKIIEPEADYSYTELLENKVRELIESIDGVTGVKVMLTLESGSEYVYAQNRNGEIRDYVIINESDRSESPILVKEISPQIRGIAIVCVGGNNPNIQSQIINLLSTLFNLSSNRIYVTG